jgi:hypothetical protein
VSLQPRVRRERGAKLTDQLIGLRALVTITGTIAPESPPGPLAAVDNGNCLPLHPDALRRS